MKKVLIPVVAWAAWMMVSCGGGNGANQALSIIEDATAKIEKAESAADIETISKQFSEDMKQIDNSVGSQLSEEDKNKILEATRAFTDAAMKKAVELSIAENANQ